MWDHFFFFFLRGSIQFFVRRLLAEISSTSWLIEIAELAFKEALCATFLRMKFQSAKVTVP